MKTYTANEELIAVLKKNDFVQRKYLFEKRSGKKSFKRFATSLKEIVLDESAILVLDAGNVLDKKSSLTEKELKVLILYLILKKTDALELTNNLQFTYDKAVKLFTNLQLEFDNKINVDTRRIRITKLKRIIDTYTTIAL